MLKMASNTVQLVIPDTFRCKWVNSLTKDKILDLYKIKNFTDDKKRDSKIELSDGKIRKQCGKRRYRLPVFSPFSTMFTKAYFSGS